MQKGNTHTQTILFDVIALDYGKCLWLCTLSRAQKPLRPSAPALTASSVPWLIVNFRKLRLEPVMCTLLSNVCVSCGMLSVWWSFIDSTNDGEKPEAADSTKKGGQNEQREERDSKRMVIAIQTNKVTQSALIPTLYTLYTQQSKHCMHCRTFTISNWPRCVCVRNLSSIFRWPQRDRRAAMVTR